MKTALRMGLLVALMTMNTVCAMNVVRTVPVTCIRVRDEMAVHIGDDYVASSQVLLLRTDVRSAGVDNESGRKLAHLLLTPILIRGGGEDKWSIRELKPQISVSHGRVWRLAVRDKDGSEVTEPSKLTSACVFVLDIEFPSAVPKEFVVGIQVAAARAVKPGDVFLYTPSNDGFEPEWIEPAREHFYFRATVGTGLGRWSVRTGGRFLADTTTSWLEVKKGKQYLIHIGEGVNE